MAEDKAKAEAEAKAKTQAARQKPAPHEYHWYLFPPGVPERAGQLVPRHLDLF